MSAQCPVCRRTAAYCTCGQEDKPNATAPLAVRVLASLLLALVISALFVSAWDSAPPVPTQSVQTTEAARTVAVTPEMNR